jgi:hypothetical protein
MAAKKETKKLIRAAKAQGFEVTLGGGGHYRLRPPTKDSPLIFVSVSPSDANSLKATLAQLRRAGFAG